VAIAAHGRRLVDTNILVYRHDGRDPVKHAIASQLIRDGIATRSLCLPYQALVEFVSATTRASRSGPLLDPQDARAEAEELMAVCPVLYPNDATLRLAMGARQDHRLPWFDALIWSYAEYYGCPEILSEDMQHGALLGRVIVRNPFHAVQDAIR
jgi:predicted nucleic acid-binding protein